ncbi:MAG: MBOAT family protein [Bacteroidales bacterium]|nr:MBOAT family protein [Bacteroidales bacterium]
MVFSDLFFLFVFIPAFAVCYIAAKAADKHFFSSQNNIRNAVLILFSLIFYAWGEPVYLFLMIGTVAINYLVGKHIANSDANRRKIALSIGVACNILILGIFKYAGFVAQTFNSIGIPMPVPDIRLPIGISFYIFQSISYLVDVYRKDAKPQQKFYNLLLYISMFPQLIAGPIVRYNTIANEIDNRTTTIDDISEGIFRFLIGLGKKVIIANQLGTISDQLLVNSLGTSTAGAWVGLLAFSLQIYFDFSGYSDMAIGMGRCMGFHFNENFNHPYTCTSVTDFWRKWHISLGQFFRDYVYIPMGGNRQHQWLNIFCVWFLTGMWHGASWNFILWGLYFGIVLVIEKVWLLQLLKRIPALGHFYSLLAVYVGWGIFYFDNFESMQTFFQSFFHSVGDWTNLEAKQAIAGNLWLWMVALIFCIPVRTWAENRIAQPTVKYAIRTAVSLAIIFLSVSLLVGATNNAFLYFRF